MLGKLGFISEGVDINYFGGAANEKGGFFDTRVVSRGIRNDFVKGDVFIPTSDVPTRPSGFHMFPHGEAQDVGEELGGSLQGLLDVLQRKPSKLGLELLQIFFCEFKALK